jgi:hypothetical protein
MAAAALTGQVDGVDIVLVSLCPASVDVDYLGALLLYFAAVRDNQRPIQHSESASDVGALGGTRTPNLGTLGGSRGGLILPRRVRAVLNLQIKRQTRRLSKLFEFVRPFGLSRYGCEVYSIYTAAAQAAHRHPVNLGEEEMRVSVDRPGPVAQKFTCWEAK